jgi:murein L,D-transpeptidase YafK
MQTSTVARNLALGILLGLFVSSAADASGTILHADKVVVIKDEKLLLLLHKGEILKSYKVSVGRNPGRRVRQGDNRTPEGAYVIDRRNPRSSFYKALHISYPNASDVRIARQLGVSPGGEVAIHGLPEGFEDLGASHADLNWTRGCIAVSNEEMDEIWELVADGTPVKIVP